MLATDTTSRHGRIEFWTANSGTVTEKLCITRDGLVGIGTSGPDTLLTCSTSDNTFAARFKSTNGIFRILPFETGLGVKLSALNGNESAFEHLAIQAASHSFVTGTTERARIDSSGRLLVGTVTQVGTVNGGILQLGSGITFPATAVAASDANTLDDYEEGTWTPVIRGSSTAGTYELITAIGFYTKIGRQVTLSMVLKLDTTITGGGTGYTQITGLPFGHKDNSQPALACATSGIDYSTNYTSIFFCPISGNSTTTWFLSETGDNVIENDLPISAISANDFVTCSSSYITS